MSLPDRETWAPISASLGAMGSLLRKLDMLLEPSQGILGLHKGAKRWTHLLKDDLEEITSYLEELSEVEDPPLTAKCWMKDVRELSYDIENYIGSFVLPGHVANIKTRCGRRRRRQIRLWHINITRLLETNKKLNRRKRVAARISDFRMDAQEALERHKRYELHCCTSIRRKFTPTGRLPRSFEEGAGVIIDDRMKQFMDSMADQRDLQLKVVSVVGSEGIGKTTFVKVLYHKLKGQFDCRAFIRLTQKPDIKTVLRDILTQVQQQQQQHHNHCEDPDLLGKIREHLQYKRYLIVIDDLWSASIWDVISYAFPGGKMGSRIITSTQIEDVALACCYYHSEYVFKMRPLDEDLSRELFFNSLFFSENEDLSRELFFNSLFCSENEFPQKMKDILSKIVKICGGLPLATTVIASLLATHPVILMEQWTYIYDSLSSKLNTCSSASEGMKLVVNFSYNNLSCHLKTCLLYLSIYPEGYTLCKDDLVKQWVAEGFIDGTEGREMETAESYFHELISRRFLQPECIKYTGEIASCSVHEVVRDLIAQKSLEENFVVALDNYRRNVSLSEKVHRLSLHFTHTKYAMTNIRSSQVWSLTCFGLSKCMPSIREFKLLRVLNLNLSGHDDDEEDIIDLTWISELLQLRYLKVASDICLELPKHMGGLQYLETVDISKKVTDVPSDIIHLPCLLHLHLPFETNLMDWLDMTGPAASVWSFGKPTDLQYLYLTCFIPVADHLQRNILSILGSLFRGLVSLKTLAFIISSTHKNAVAHGPSEEIIAWDWDDFALPLLERFEWLLHSCSFSRVPKWIGKHGNLCILKISVRELMRDGVNILGELPALTTLSLYVKIPPIERIIFDKVGFSVLKYFKFKCSTVPWLKFETDAMPNLQKLKLGFSSHSHRVDQQSTVPICIDHLPGLKDISAKVADASSDAESALIATVSNHPRNPRIRMQLVDWNSYGHGVWYTVSKKGKPLDLEEDKIPDPEKGMYDHCAPQYKDSRDDQNKEAYVRLLSREFDHRPASGRSYHHKSDEYSKRHMLASILLDESAEPTALDLSLFEDITNNFSTEKEIDQGGFGMVYKGILGVGIVAVKRLCGTHETVHGELTRVVDCLMTVKHNNILRFLGYCTHMHPNFIEKGGESLRIERQDMLLCFEYLHNGSLRRHITEESCGFEWHTRFQIMKGICQGLDYLHENHIIHLHLKPENILLDANMVPKIADYAYARLLGEDRRTATQGIAASLDYLAPEYFEDGAISVKSDIYSLGVIIMQMVTGHKDHPNIRSVLGGWRSRLESDTSQRHTVLETTYRQVKLCIELGKSCMHRDPTKRPCIRDIIDRLAEMEASEESSVTSRTSSVPKFLSGEESEASLITPSPTSGKDSLNHHQEIMKSGVPIQTWVPLSNFKLAYNMLGRADGTFDRDLAEFLDRRVPPDARAQDGVSSFDHVIDTSTGLEVRIYRASAVTLPMLDFLAGAPSPDPFPVILFFHGGSFAHSSSSTAIYDNLCRRFVKLSKGVVVSVNYRRAPEHRYPCAYEDGWTALNWAMSQPFLRSGRGEDARPRIFLSGDSSGGNIAHHVAVRAADTGIGICGNILLNAMFGGTERTDSERRLDGKYFVTLQDRDWYWKAYLPEDADRDHPACNPFGPNGRRLRGLPFTRSLIIVSGLDLTCDRQLAYAEGLREDGHHVKLVYRETATIGFYLLPNTDHYHEVMEEIADFLRANLYTALPGDHKTHHHGRLNNPVVPICSPPYTAAAWGSSE